MVVIVTTRKPIIVLLRKKQHLFKNAEKSYWKSHLRYNHSLSLFGFQNGDNILLKNGWDIWELSLYFIMGLPMCVEAGEAGKISAVPSSAIWRCPTLLAWTRDELRVGGDLEPLLCPLMCPLGSFRSSGSSKESMGAAQSFSPSGKNAHEKRKRMFNATLCKISTLYNANLLQSLL